MKLNHLTIFGHIKICKQNTTETLGSFTLHFGLKYVMIFQLDAIKYFVFFQLDIFRAYTPILKRAAGRHVQKRG
jgi:hypothetical protein